MSVDKIGVVGAGTMGAGIAQLAATAAGSVVLVDTDPTALETAVERIRGGLDKMVQKNRLSGSEAESAIAGLTTDTALTALSGADLVIEVVSERLQVKLDVFRSVLEHVGPDCVLATNTSSLSIAAIAGPLDIAERLVGMHFFNPPPVMRLMELVSGPDTASAAVSLARRVGEAMGRTVVDAADTPGFIVNRCGRPFSLEALSLLRERIADAETIDHICQRGGFAMGPLSLLDLVGLDVSMDVATSFYEQSFGEPRWRPSPIVTRMIASGHLGRKTQRGFHDYREAKPPHREDQHSEVIQTTGSASVVGDTPLAETLRRRIADSSWTLVAPEEAELVLDCRATIDETIGAVRATLCTQSLATRDPEAVGFHLLATSPTDAALELTRTERTDPDAVTAVESLAAALGLCPTWVGDAPGLVLGRIVTQLVNEAFFASEEAVASRQDIDTAMVLGLNHPLGPIEWGEAIGLDTVTATLEGLRDAGGGDRYRLAGSLRRAMGLAEAS